MPHKYMDDIITLNEILKMLLNSRIKNKEQQYKSKIIYNHSSKGWTVKLIQANEEKVKWWNNSIHPEIVTKTSSISANFFTQLLLMSCQHAIWVLSRAL